jgi:hypothetical protein
MSTPFMELFNQREIEIILDALTMYKNRCKTNGTRKLSGYGTATEEMKREQWVDKAEEVDAVLSKVSEESI